MMNSQMHYLPLTPATVLPARVSVRRADHPDPAPHPPLRLYEARRRSGRGAAAVVRLADRQLFQHPDHGPARALRPSGEVVDFYGMRYVVPLVTSWPGTVLAVNVGGAVIPTVDVDLSGAALPALAESPDRRRGDRRRDPLDGHSGAGRRHCRAGIRAGRRDRHPRFHPVARICGAARLYRRLHGNVDRRRSCSTSTRSADSARRSLRSAAPARSTASS